MESFHANDAFGSWQPNASMHDVTKHILSCARYLLQEKMAKLDRVFHPERLFLAAVARSKFDTKIVSLYAIYDNVDHLIF